jgi:dolichyl-phosphate beta-glucosyltransferase
MSYEAYRDWKQNKITAEPHLSVVIPAYNEAERIVPTIGAIASHISSLGFPWELLVADDGSTDDTVALVKELELANVRVLETTQNGGKGSAVRRGMLAANGRYVLFTDADNSTPIEELDRLMKAVESGGYDIAIGSRAAEGAEEANKSRLRHLMSGGLRLLVRTVLGIGVRDTQCGFKLFTREAAHRLHRAQKLFGFSFDLEILYLAQKLGYRVAELPVRWFDAPGSKVDTRKEAQRFLRDMTRIRLIDWQGGYSHA